MPMISMIARLRLLRMMMLRIPFCLESVVFSLSGFAYISAAVPPTPLRVQPEFGPPTRLQPLS